VANLLVGAALTIYVLKGVGLRLSGSAARDLLRPDGRLILTASDGGARLWDLATGAELLRLIPLPDSDEAHFEINLRAAEGTSLEGAALQAERIAREVRRLPGVEFTLTTLGDNAQHAPNAGNIYVKLVAKNERSRSVEMLASDLRRQMSHVAGATISIFTNDFSAGFKQILVQVRGQDAKQLAVAADILRAEIQKIPGAVDIGLSSKGQKPELEIALNRGVAGSMGSPVTIASRCAQARGTASTSAYPPPPVTTQRPSHSSSARSRMAR